MYKSPIEIIDCFNMESMIDKIGKQIAKQHDKNIYQAIVKTGINVDKEELIKALSYDRNQYDKGFEDGVKEFAKTYKEHVLSFAGMFTDNGFLIDMDAVLSAVDFIKEKMVGEK